MADTIIITGASRGIGLATAQRIADDGHRVVGVARNPPESGFPGAFHAADLGDEADTARVMAEIAGGYTVDGIVNNVGINILEPLGDVDLDHLRQVLDMNLRTAVQCTQAVVDGMRERGYGRIVNVSSRGALGRARRTSYAAAKAGIVGVTRTWAIELAAAGITVNCVAPGPTATEMFQRNNLEGDRGEEVRRQFVAEIPMGRIAEPDEVATAIAFFLRRDASFITGQFLHVCGGMTVGSMPL